MYTKEYKRQENIWKRVNNFVPQQCTNLSNQTYSTSSSQKYHVIDFVDLKRYAGTCMSVIRTSSFTSVTKAAHNSCGMTTRREYVDWARSCGLWMIHNRLVVMVGSEGQRCLMEVQSWVGLTQTVVSNPHMIARNHFLKLLYYSMKFSTCNIYHASVYMSNICVSTNSAMNSLSLLLLKDSMKESLSKMLHRSFDSEGADTSVII